MMNEKSTFFAFISRMKYINRWALMRNTESENLSEHSLETAMIVNLLGIIRNMKFGGGVNPEKLALAALYHDSSEIITGDMPTPVKYINPDINDAYKKIEFSSKEKILNMVPDELRGYYENIIFYEEHNPEEYKLIKAADKISAYIKCIQELKMGNMEFESAKRSIKENIDKMNIPEPGYFIDTFIDAYLMSLDEIEQANKADK